MNWISMINFLNLLGYINTIIVVSGIAIGAVLWWLGIIPVLMRLGNGLSRRKIVIFAKSDSIVSLENLLHDCKLFKKSNILKITNDGDFGISSKATLFLIHWPDWIDKIEAGADISAGRAGIATGIR
jgi:hypothetical protein